MKLRALVVGGVIAGGVIVAGGQASAALPHCGGQGAAPQPVPYTCSLPGERNGHTFLIDGSHFTAVVQANGVSVGVTIAVDVPRSVPTAVRIVHHVGKSGDGGAQDRASGVLPAGAKSITLVDSVPCRDGQLDVKAVFVGNGDSKGRIGGPWIRNGEDCQTATTAATTQGTTPSSGATSTPSSSTVTTLVRLIGRLPDSGRGLAAFWASLAFMAVGGLLLLARRIPAEADG